MKKLLALLLLAGCATTTTAPVPAGPDTYLISNKSPDGRLSGGEMLAGLYKEANDFCASQNRKLLTVSSSSVSGAAFRPPSGALTFQCLREGDPRLAK